MECLGIQELEDSSIVFRIVAITSHTEHFTLQRMIREEIIKEFKQNKIEIPYKQVVIQEQESKEVQDYARAYSEMKPKEAAAIFDTMTDNFDLVAKILQSMTAKNRGDILAKMDAANAARLTKIMNPDS